MQIATTGVYCQRKKKLDMYRLSTVKIILEWQSLGSMASVARTAQNLRHARAARAGGGPSTVVSNLQSSLSTLTSQNDWRLVRFLQRDSGTWHQSTDDLNGTDVYGTPYDFTNSWSVPFGEYTQLFLSTYDNTYWMYLNKAALLTPAGSASENLLVLGAKGSSNAGGTSVDGGGTITDGRYFYLTRDSTQAGDEAQPWACLGPVDAPANSVCLYGEASWPMGNHFTNVAHVSNTGGDNGGLMVYVR